MAYEVVHCPARSFPARLKRAETTHRLPGYHFGWRLPWSRCEAFTADFIVVGPMDSGVVVPWSAYNAPVSVLVPVMSANATAIRYSYRLVRIATSGRRGCSSGESALESRGAQKGMEGRDDLRDAGTLSRCQHSKLGATSTPHLATCTTHVSWLVRRERDEKPRIGLDKGLRLGDASRTSHF